MQQKNLIILAIETSCDDTSIAINKNGNLLCNVTETSLKQHQEYGGIVPEIASRSHCELIDKVFKQALKLANINIKDITHIAYTSQPGLINSLHIAKVYAKQLASMLKIPLIPLDHMIGHVFSYYVDHNDLSASFPFLSLVVSGGHTFIAKFYDYDKYEILNSTIDDAVGEALDKIGRALNLKYPGGISIDDIYDESKATIKIINHSSSSINFSFSGVKTATLNIINQANMKSDKIDTISIASSFLKWCIDDLLKKTQYYLSINKDIKTIVLSGGVSANRLLREKILQLKNYEILLPNLKYTGDNAAMMAIYAYLLIKMKLKNI